MYRAARFIGLEKAALHVGKLRSILMSLLLSLPISDTVFAQRTLDSITGFGWILIYDFTGVAVFVKRDSVHEQTGVLVATLKFVQKGSTNLSTAPDLFAATDCKQSLDISEMPFGAAQPPLQPATDPKQSLIIRTICGLRTR